MISLYVSFPKKYLLLFVCVHTHIQRKKKIGQQWQSGAESVFPKYCFPLKGPRFLGEKADQRSGAGNVQNEPRTSSWARNQGSLGSCPKLLIVLSLNCVWLFYDSMDYSPSGSSVHRIFQTRILEWVVISFSQGSSQTRDQTHISCFGRWIFYHWPTRKANQKAK